MASAKKGGGIDALYPNRDPAQAPWHMATAVSHALTVLSWMELLEEERPPEAIWLHPDLLNEHFEDLEARRRSERTGREPVEQVPMMENEYTQSLRRK